MHVHVKLFALLREKAGTDTVTIEVPEHATVMQVATRVEQLFPGLAPYLEKVRFALHMDFVDASTTVTEGDEVSLIPPVSGGK